jgi:transposase
MYVETVPNRNSRPAVLLREGWREHGKIRKRTLANLSDWSDDRLDALRAVLKGEVSFGAGAAPQPFDIVRTRPHGHVVAALGMLRRSGLDTVIAARRTPQRERVLGMIVARILEPGSKLATARGLSDETLSSTLGEVLGLSTCTEDELYEAMDWLLARQDKIETALAKRHLGERTLALYDVTSTYFEGRHCPLARFGHSRDGKRDKLQIVFGVLTNAQGCPVAVEVFAGNTADPKTLGAAVAKLRERFGLERVVVVGDRGMITSARIREDLQTEAGGIEWITALRAPQIQALRDTGALQLSLFDQRDLAEITDPAYAGERLIACRNPLLAEERARKRGELLEATERELKKIQLATERARRPLAGKVAIALRVGRVLGRFKMKKHFRLEITESGFSFARDQTRIEREAALDGIYVVRTSVPAEVLSGERAVESYKGLSVVERAFRCLKTVDLKVRPIHHHLEDRVRSHVFLCLLAYYVEWHMRRALAPVLFDDDDRADAHAQRRSIVAPAQRSARAQRKATTKRTDAGDPVHSFQTLLQDLATIAKNRIQPKDSSAPAFDVITRPTPFQQRALDLLGVSLRP